MLKKIYEKGTWLIKGNESFDTLTITEGAELTAPPGKYLALTVDGAGKPLKPGTYTGNVVISVAEYFVEEVYPSVNRTKPLNLETAICIDAGRLIPEKGLPAVVYGGKVTDKSANDVYIATANENFAGIIVDGDSEYTINKASIEMDGPGYNDFVGMGAGVAAFGNARVTINDSDINLTSITRCAVHVGGKSVVTVNNSRMSNRSPICEMGSWSWGIGVRGTNRLNQLADDGTVYYNNCHLATNGWGVLSVDGSNLASMFVKDSTIELTGPNAHGYGIFCIGPTHVHMDHTKFNVYGYPLMLMGMENKATCDFINGCEVTGRRYGIHVIGDTGSVVTIKDSSFNTGKSTMVVKGSSGTTFNIENASLEATNGVILQLMDNDDPSMSSDFIDVSMYTQADEPVSGRDITAVNPSKDVVMNISNSELKGNFFNSTTNLRSKESKERPADLPPKSTIKAPGALAGSIPGEGDGPGGPGGPDGGVPMMGGPDPSAFADKAAPKNLGLNLVNVKLEGIISSALQAYRDGITYIDETTREELCNVKQTAAAPVNNGVSVTLDGNTVWTVTGKSYLTSLALADGAQIKAPAGKVLTITVNGSAKPVTAGFYKGIIELTVI